VVHGRHVTFLDDAVLLGKLGFGKGLPVALVSALHTRLVILVCQWKDGIAYGLVGSVTNLLAHELVHPVVGLVILAAAVREAGDDKRHVGGCCWGLVGCVSGCFWFSRMELRSLESMVPSVQVSCLD
jgi:hypothetical protein